MTRPHDMGGRFGDGAVVPEPDGFAQLEDWQARALALTLAAGGLKQWNIDTGRHARERLAPVDYARFTYFEKWISALADLMVEKELISRADLAGGAPQASPLAGRAIKADQVSAAFAAGDPADRPCDAVPKFSPGDMVATRRIAENLLVEGGHTRLPQYAAGAQGRIRLYHGTHVFPDSAAHGLGDAPQPLYAVAFPASQLWANPEHPEDEVILDLWESYLEPCS